jgi:hypothetical protein
VPGHAVASERRVDLSVAQPAAVALTFQVLAYLGGEALSIPDAACIVVATPPMNTQSLASGEIWYSVRSGTAWLWYSATVGNVQSVTNSTTLGAFIS